MQMFFRIINRIKYFLFHVQNDWEIGFIQLTIEDVIASGKVPKIHWLKMPRNVFWADPFGVQVDEKYYIFYEEFRKDLQYGVINCMVMDSHFKMLSNQTIIDENTHFSFPQIIPYNGEYYMLPETLQKNKLSLYKCTTFPWKWEEENVLLEEPCSDSILFLLENEWYLFYSKANAGHNLRLKKSNDLTGDWSLQQEYLISQSPANARNGGEVFKCEKGIFRISQYGKTFYGEKIGIHKVQNILPAAYQETLIREISLQKGLVSCCHTLNSCGNITLIDRRRERLYIKSLKEMLAALLDKFKSN